MSIAVPASDPSAVKSTLGRNAPSAVHQAIDTDEVERGR